MYPLTLDLIDFLLSPPARQSLVDLSGVDLSDRQTLPLLTSLRASFAPDEAAALLDQARLRLRAGDKFPNTQQLLFTDEALQQASSRAVAAYRAGELAAALYSTPSMPARVADLGCGIGADTIALAQAGLEVLAIERDPVRARIAQINVAALGLAERVEVRCDDWTTLTLTPTLSQGEREPESEALTPALSHELGEPTLTPTLSQGERGSERGALTPALFQGEREPELEALSPVLSQGERGPELEALSPVISKGERGPELEALSPVLSKGERGPELEALSPVLSKGERGPELEALSPVLSKGERGPELEALTPALSQGERGSERGTLTSAPSHELGEPTLTPTLSQGERESGSGPLSLWERAGVRVSAAFVDPSRRAHDHRIFSLAEMDPPLATVRALAERLPAVAVKTMPGVADAEIPADAEVEFISERGQMKEALLRFGSLRTGAARRATLLPGPHRLDSNAPLNNSPATEPAACLLEPDPAVIRATLVQHLASALGARQIDPTIAYLTADHWIDTPFARCWTVLRHGPFSLKTLNRWLREMGAGAVIVKKRGSAIDPDQFRRRLKTTAGGIPLTVFLTRALGRPWMIVGQEN